MSFKKLDMVLNALLFFLAVHGGMNLFRHTSVRTTLPLTLVLGVMVLGLVWYDRRRRQGGEGAKDSQPD